MVVYGHTPVEEPEWLNRTINIDTGCVFGGKLTALERFVRREPLRRVHECVFGVLALESEPVDPRL
jgi:hypothetical protein